MWAVFYGSLAAFLAIWTSRSNNVELSKMGILLFFTWCASILIRTTIEPAHLFTAYSSLDLTGALLTLHIWRKTRLKEILGVAIIFCIMLAAHFVDAVNFFVGSFNLFKYSTLLNILFLSQIILIAKAKWKDQVKNVDTFRGNSKHNCISSGISLCNPKDNQIGNVS